MLNFTLRADNDCRVPGPDLPGTSIEIGRADFARRIHWDIFRILWRTADTCCRHGRLCFIGIREISPIGGTAARVSERPEKCDPCPDKRRGKKKSGKKDRPVINLTSWQIYSRGIVGIPVEREENVLESRRWSRRKKKRMFSNCAANVKYSFFESNNYSNYPSNITKVIDWRIHKCH